MDEPDASERRDKGSMKIAGGTTPPESEYVFAESLAEPIGQ
ncbi:hypothetical protein [Roseibium sp.]